eukprot:3371628-Prymnesium_polylepis.1
MRAVLLSVLAASRPFFRASEKLTYAPSSGLSSSSNLVVAAGRVVGRVAAHRAAAVVHEVIAEALPMKLVAAT